MKRHLILNAVIAVSLLIQLIAPSFMRPVHAQSAPQSGEIITTPITLSRAQSAYSDVAANGTLTVTLEVTNNLPPTIAPEIDATATVTESAEILATFDFTADPNTLRNVVMTDELLNGATLISADPPASQDGATLIFNVGDIAPMQSADVTLVLSVPSGLSDFTPFDVGATAFAARANTTVTATAPVVMIAPSEFADFLTDTVDVDLDDAYMLRAAAQLGNDATTLFAFVRDMDNEVYAGSLRGTRGTLWSAAGNSVDKSSLLIALLRNHAIPARYVHGTLAEADAQTIILSMFSELGSNRRGYVPADATVSDPANDPVLLTDAQTHTWVEAYIDGTWTTLDPAFADAAVGDLFGLPSERSAELSNEMRHTVDLAMRIEQFHQVGQVGGDILQETEPLTATFYSAETVGLNPTLSFLVNTQQRGGLTFASVEHTYTPYFQLGDRDFVLVGDPVQDLLTNFPLGSRFTTGVWLDTTLRSPNGASETYTRIVKDLIGSHARQSLGTFDLPDRDQSPLLTSGDIIQLQVHPQSVTPQEAVLRSVSDMMASYEAYGQGVAALHSADTTLPTLSTHLSALNTTQTAMLNTLGLQYHHTANDPDGLLNDQMLFVRSYAAQPEVVLMTQTTSGERAKSSIELLNIKKRTVAAPGQNSDAVAQANALRSMQAKQVEINLFSKISAAVETALYTLEDAVDSGIVLKAITPYTLEQLAPLPLPDNAKAHISSAVAAGNTVIVPQEMVTTRTGVETIGWMVLAPDGHVSFVNADGTFAADAPSEGALAILSEQTSGKLTSFFVAFVTTNIFFIVNIANALVRAGVAPLPGGIGALIKVIPAASNAASQAIAACAGAPDPLLCIAAARVTQALIIGIYMATAVKHVIDPSLPESWLHLAPVPTADAVATSSVSVLANQSADPININEPLSSLSAFDTQALWRDTTTYRSVVVSLSAPTVTLSDENGVIGTGALSMTTAAQIGLSGDITYTLDAADLSFFDVTNGSADATLTTVAETPYTLTLDDAEVVFDGNALVGDFTATVDGIATFTAAKIAPITAASTQLTDGNLLLGAHAGFPNGHALVGLNGTAMVADGVAVVGSADYFSIAVSSSRAMSADITIATTLDDMFNLAASAPDGWTVALHETTLTITPAQNATHGDYIIPITVQSQQHPELTLFVEHTVTIAQQDNVSLSLAPDPLITVPMGEPLDEARSRGIFSSVGDGRAEVADSAFVLTLHNDSTQSHTFEIDVTGLPAGWLKVSGDVTQVTLAAGESAEIGLYVQPAGNLPAAGTMHTINATATNGNGLTAATSIDWTMPAQPFPFITLNEVVYATPDDSATFTALTTNVGNSADTFSVESIAARLIADRYDDTPLPVSPTAYDTGNLTSSHTQTLTIDTADTQIGERYFVRSYAAVGEYEPDDTGVLQIVSAEALCIYNASLTTDAPLSTALLNLGATIDSFVSDPNQRPAIVNAIYAVRGLVQQFATAGLNDDLDTVAQAIVDGNDDAAMLLLLCEVTENVETESTQATFHARLSPNVATAKVGEPVELTLTIDNEDETPIAFAIDFAGTSENATISAGQTQTFSRTVVAVAGEQLVTAVVSADRVLTRTATVNGVEQLAEVVGVSADPFLIEPDGPTTIAAQISNLYFGDSTTAASVTVFNDGGGEIANVDAPLILTPNSITEYTLTDLDTTGWETGAYTVVVAVEGSVGETVVLVGRGVSAALRLSSGGETVAPGNPTITTLITTTTNLTTGELSRTTHHAPNTEWSDNTPASDVGILAAAAIGDLDGDGNPEIVVPGYVGQIADTDGRLYAYAGTGGAPLWTVDMERAATPAIADIDGDGDAEVLVIARDAFYVIDHNGNVIHRDPTIKSRYDAPSITQQRYHWGGVTVANLDADVDPEIVVSATDGAVVLDNDFSVLKRYGDDFGLQAQQTIPVVAELTGDGAPDILAAYDETLYLFDYANDSLAWTHTFIDGTTAINTFGSPAVADLDGDDALDIIAVWDGHVQRISAAGTLVWSRATGGIRPSSPIIADVDGDDAPEIIFTVYDNSHDELFVFEADGSILWQKTVLDSSASSSAVGAYDLDGDGSAEILYNGSDQGFAIFDGRDGSEIYSDSAISSGTLDEIIPVADVDGDGSAEIIVGDENGIYVIGNDTDWIGARATFNQYNYHASNINDDLSVPPVLDTTWDSFRTQRSDGYAKPSIMVTLTHVFEDGSAENRTYSQSTTHKTNSFTQTVAALQPSEVRAVSQRTTVAYSYGDNSGVMTLPAQNVIGGRLGTLAPFAQTVAPNGTATYAVTLQHGANAIAVTGLPQNWVAIDGTTIHITPSADAGGDYHFAVVLGNDDGATDVLQARLTVVEIADLTITPEYATTDVGETVPYTISVTNLHTETISFNLTVTGDVDASFVGGSRLTVGASATGTKVVEVVGSVGLGSFAVSAETINTPNSKSQAFAAIDVQPTHLMEATVAADAVSVGAGGTAIFDLSVTNLGTLPDSYELSANIFGIGVGRFTANGLRITSVEIQPSLFNTAQIDLLFDVPANVAAGTYSGFVRVRSEQTEATIPLTVEVLGAGVAVDVVNSRGTTLDVTIENTGDSADSFTLSLTGALAPFATLSAASVSLDSGASTTVQLTMNADEIALADRYTIGVVAQSQNDARVMGADSAEIPFNPLEAVAIAWSPSEQTSLPNAPVTFLLTVTNTGRTAGFFNTSTTTRANLDGMFNRTVVYLPPHTSATLIFRTTAPAENGLHTLDATVAGTTVSDSAQATLIVGDELAVGLRGGQARTNVYLVWLSLSLLLVTAGVWLVWRRDF